MVCQFASKPYAPAFLFFSASSAGLAALALGVPEMLLQVKLAFVTGEPVSLNIHLTSS